MVDIHSHVLPGLDDGAGTLEQSLEMLQLAAATGTTDIVATPHANNEFMFHPLRVEQAFRHLRERNAAAVTLHLGCDFHLNYENLSDALNNPAKYTINHGRYLMVELPDLVALAPMRQALKQLAGVGILPILTHPERNPSLQPKLHELKNWVSDGCFLQLTAQSLLGDFGPAAKRAADSLMNAALVHFVASDAHDTVRRSPDLSQAYKYVSTKYGSACADTLFLHNPAAVLSSDFISPLPVRRSSVARLFTFWK